MMVHILDSCNPLGNGRVREDLNRIGFAYQSEVPFEVQLIL